MPDLCSCSFNTVPMASHLQGKLDCLIRMQFAQLFLIYSCDVSAEYFSMH